MSNSDEELILECDGTAAATKMVPVRNNNLLLERKQGLYKYGRLGSSGVLQSFTSFKGQVKNFTANKHYANL